MNPQDRLLALDEIEDDLASYDPVPQDVEEAAYHIRRAKDILTLRAEDDSRDGGWGHTSDGVPDKG